ncbi:MAG: hypothetical protein SPK49_07620 [Erysipelotrichaceae bacterium]|nr:hypothetical protein [Erysipelotrichaceae bacterium]
MSIYFAISNRVSRTDGDYTVEKVCLLADVLKFMESDELLSEGIALKGGTAINLTIFDASEPPTRLI